MDSEKEQRHHYSQEEKSDIVSRFEQSGKNISEFCRQEGINTSTLNNWIRAKGKKENEHSNKQPGGFVSVKLPEVSVVKPFMRICFPDGRRIIFYAEPNVALVKSLVDRV